MKLGPQVVTHEQLHRDVGLAVRKPVDVIHAREVLAAYVREAVDPFTDEELERRDRREGVAQDEDLAWPVAGITAVPGAESVLEDRLPRIVDTRAGSFHMKRACITRRARSETREKSRVLYQKREWAIAGLSARSEFRRNARDRTLSLESYCVTCIPFAR